MTRKLLILGGLALAAACFVRAEARKYFIKASHLGPGSMALSCTEPGERLEKVFDSDGILVVRCVAR